MATVVASQFELVRHDRIDAKIARLVAECAQDYMPATKLRDTSSCARVIGRNSRSHGKPSSRGLRTPTSAVPAPSKSTCMPDTWSRPKTKTGAPRPITLQGLCNRCSKGSTKSLIPQFCDYLRNTEDYDGVVNIIMRSIGGTDTLGGVYVDMLRSLRGDHGSKDSSCDHQKASACLDSFAAKFVRGGPQLISLAPNPIEDYDGFCKYVSRKDSTLRVTVALASLGFEQDLLACVHSALDVVEDSETDYDKDTAVKYVGACAASVIADQKSKSDCQALLAGIAFRVDCLCKAPELCNIDNRTRFAMMDLARVLFRANATEARKVAWATSGRTPNVHIVK